MTVDINTLPKIFLKLAAKTRNMDALSTSALSSFLATPTTQESFLPEVVDIIGEDTFLQLVIMLGGKTIELPTVETILANTFFTE